MPLPSHPADCKYKFESWGGCSAQTGLKTRSGILKKALYNAQCEETVYVTKPCSSKIKSKSKGQFPPLLSTEGCCCSPGQAFFKGTLACWGWLCQWCGGFCKGCSFLYTVKSSFWLGGDAGETLFPLQTTAIFGGMGIPCSPH